MIKLISLLAWMLVPPSLSAAEPSGGTIVELSSVGIFVLLATSLSWSKFTGKPSK